MIDLDLQSNIVALRDRVAALNRDGLYQHEGHREKHPHKVCQTVLGHLTNARARLALLERIALQPRDIV